MTGRSCWRRCQKQEVTCLSPFNSDDQTIVSRGCYSLMYLWTPLSEREDAGRRKARKILRGYEQKTMMNTVQIGLTVVSQASYTSLGAVQTPFTQSCSIWGERFGWYKILCCPLSVVKNQKCKSCPLRMRFQGRNAATHSLVALPASFVKPSSFRKFPHGREDVFSLKKHMLYFIFWSTVTVFGHFPPFFPPLCPPFFPLSFPFFLFPSLLSSTVYNFLKLYCSFSWDLFFIGFIITGSCRV